MLAGALASLQFTKAFAEPGSVHRLRIFHTNDLEGRLLPGSYFDEPSRGGFARLLTVLEAADDRSLILDSGDALGEETLARFDHGSLVAKLMSRAGYDAMAAGNHEFDYGLDTLAARVRQMGFPLLGANVEIADTTLFHKWVLLERAGLKIGIVGLLAPAAKNVINHTSNPGLVIKDPAESLNRILPQLRGADFLIALVHMEEDQALRLAQEFPDLDLVLAGGFRSVEEKNSAPHQMQLANGTRVMSTPGNGAYVGRIDIELIEVAGGTMVEHRFDARLLPLDDAVAPDPEVEKLILLQADRFARRGGEVIGVMSVEPDNKVQFVADIARVAMGAEIGMLNHGTLHPISLAGEITRADIRRLVRYDDLLVVLDVKGHELTRLASESSRRRKEGQRLSFAGFDPQAKTVNGRKVVADEQYRLATTSYLAAGGDGYLTPQRLEPHRLPDIDLQNAIVGYLGRGAETPPRRNGRVWKMRSKLNSSITRTGLSARARSYRDVSFLSGENALAWNANFNLQLSYETPSARVENLLRSNFGQIRSGGESREGADRLQFDVIYRQEQRQAAPFAAMALNTVWTKDTGERPLSVRGSAGLHKDISKRFKLRLGLGLERDFAAEQSDVGLEILPEYQVESGGRSFSSSAKLFVGTSRSGVFSVQQYNSLALHLRRDLHLTVDASFFAHRSKKVGGTGLKSELQAGLGYLWNTKWF